MLSLLEAIMQSMIHTHRDLIQSESFKLTDADAMRKYAMNKLLDLSRQFNDYSERFAEISKHCENKAKDFQDRINSIF